MAKQQFTPGPWIAEDRARGGREDPGCGVIASDTEPEISNPSRGMVAYASRRVGMTNDECVANARLIAAAPDMLAALRSLVGVYEGQEDAPIYVQKARAAIAKAEGKPCPPAAPPLLASLWIAPGGWGCSAWSSTSGV